MWFLNEHDSNVLPQLSNALVHHDNRFKKFGQTTIRKLIERKEYREYFENLLPYLPNKEKAALEKILEWTFNRHLEENLHNKVEEILYREAFYLVLDTIFLRFDSSRQLSGQDSTKNHSNRRGN